MVVEDFGGVEFYLCNIEGNESVVSRSLCTTLINENERQAS